MSDSNENNVHPIVQKALSLAKLDSTLAPPYMEGIASSIFFDEEAVAELKEALSNYSQKDELISAVVALLNLANVLDEQDHKEAALSIIMVVATAAEPLEALAKSRDEPEKLNDS